MKKDLMKKAHELTREIKKEFPEVDYKTQLGLCISYLSENKEDNMEDNRITELKEMAKESKNYNKVWNRVEKLSQEIRGRKFNNEEIKNFHYKAENIVALAEEILKEEVKEEIKEVKVENATKKDNKVYAKYEGYDAEGMRVNVGDEIKYVDGLGWIKAENY